MNAPRIAAGHLHQIRAWGSVVVKALRYYPEGPGIDPQSCHWGFFRSIREVHVPRVDSVSQNEYQVIPRGKGVLRVPSVMKSESLILLDPSRPSRPATRILYFLCT